MTIVSEWEPGAGSLILQRAFTFTADDYEEDTTIEVVHDPE